MSNQENTEEIDQFNVINSHKMEDSYIIANFHALCRLCLNKSMFAVSLFGAAPDDENNVSLTSKIADCFELHMEPNDALPSRICYKCLFMLDKCCEFKLQCIQNENRLRQITTHKPSDADTSNSSDISNYNYTNSHDSRKQKPKEYIVEDSVVMVVDPSLDYDSSDDSEATEQVETEPIEQDNPPDSEPVHETFFKNVFMCQYCDQAFVTREKCTEHENKYHDRNLPYKCVECSLVFAERTQYVQHTKQVHGNDKPYQCPECEKCFGRRSDLRKHSIVHTGIRPYQCHYCLKSFSRNTNLSKHLRIHAGHKPHVCPLCPRSFVANGDLQKHILVHSSVKNFACRQCPQKFSRRDKLLKHELRHGPTVTPKNEIDCDNTNNMVVNVNPFSNLMTSPTQMNPETSEYDLPRVPDHISGENSFSNPSRSQNHVNQANNPSSSGKQLLSPSSKSKVLGKNKPKNIKCHQCTKRFSSLDAYKSHVSLAHIGSRVFQCKICFKKFSRKKELDRHSTIHANMKTFQCNECDQTFNRKDKLEEHEETHECLVVNMPCIECGATFEKKADLVAHIKSHFTDNYDEKSSETEIKKEDDPEDYMLDDNLYNEGT